MRGTELCRSWSHPPGQEPSALGREPPSQPTTQFVFGAQLLVDGWHPVTDPSAGLPMETFWLTFTNPQNSKRLTQTKSPIGTLGKPNCKPYVCIQLAIAFIPDAYQWKNISKCASVVDVLLNSTIRAAKVANVSFEDKAMLTSSLESQQVTGVKKVLTSL